MYIPGSCVAKKGLSRPQFFHKDRRIFLHNKKNTPKIEADSVTKLSPFIELGLCSQEPLKVTKKNPRLKDISKTIGSWETCFGENDRRAENWVQNEF